VKGVGPVRLAEAMHKAARMMRPKRIPHPTLR
jgi:hypothetical protein